MVRGYKSSFRTRLTDRRGAIPFEKSGFLVFFTLAGMLAARIDWIEVGCLSVRIAGVSVVGTRRGKIVDCRGCLGV